MLSYFTLKFIWRPSWVLLSQGLQVLLINLFLTITRTSFVHDMACLVCELVLNHGLLQWKTLNYCVTGIVSHKEKCTLIFSSSLFRLFLKFRHSFYRPSHRQTLFCHLFYLHPVSCPGCSVWYCFHAGAHHRWGNGYVGQLHTASG